MAGLGASSGEDLGPRQDHPVRLEALTVKIDVVTLWFLMRLCSFMKGELALPMKEARSTLRADGDGGPSAAFPGCV